MSKLITVELSDTQISHTILALKDYSQKLLTSAEKEAIGGEHEDYLLVNSVIKALDEQRNKS